MDFEKLLQLEDSIKDLKCTTCKNHLSYFPIYISDNKQNICGRCSGSQLPDCCYVENEVYQTLAQFVQFPCRYNNNGCLEKLCPGSMSQHEEKCPFKTTKCLTARFTQCDWEGPLPNFLNHCQDKHFDIMLQDGEFKVDLYHSHECENLLEYDSTLFVISRKYYSITNLLEISIYNLENEINVKKISSEITLKNSNRNVVVQCHSTSFDEKEVTEIFFHSLKDGKIAPIIFGKICFDKSTQGVASIDEVNDDLLEQLKCSFCSEYVMPPIYQDSSNSENTPVKLKCSVCRIKSINNYSTGFNRKSVTSETRNISLDKIASLLNYPCKYQKNGCTLVSKPATIASHLSLCPYRNCGCPVEVVACPWKGLGKDITGHIQATHPTIISSSSSEISENVLFITPSSMEPNFAKSYIIKFSGQLFRASFTVQEQRYCWTVQIIGQCQGNFTYEVEIIDKKQKGKKLVARHPCSLLITQNQLFKNKNEYCYFSKDQVEDFMLDSVITFKINIFK